MTTTAIRLTDAQITALATVLDSVGEEHDKFVYLAPVELEAFTSARSKITTAARDLVHGSSSRVKAPICYEHDRRACSDCYAEAHGRGLHAEFVVGCLPCAHEQLGASA